MEVMMGFPGAAHVRDIGVGEVQDNVRGVTDTSLSRRMIFQKEEGFGDEDQDEDELDRSSSSLGVPDDSEYEGEDGEEEVLSSTGFGSMASLEDSLPVKEDCPTTLSGDRNHSRTSQRTIATTTTSAKCIEKTKHPFNKKGRVLLWSKKNSTMLPTAASLPLFPTPDVGEDDEPHRGDRDDHDNHEDHLPTARRRTRDD
ncbi:hypothetical protein MLD38_005999 [Melastoma candidum]|uniref:Uncharacterized protein n=1 Tax=Melastoma candidum TaxID=119954 RepID=A0ACB9RQ76_9MYRT|nr:hypothetical protein MLD38_005999 [Melastoma candidum]